MNTEDIEDGLCSRDVAVQVAALERAAESVRALALAAVNGLGTSGDPLFVADKLANLGSAVVSPLRGLFAKTSDASVRILCALVLLQFDVHVGVPCLLSALTDDELGELVAQRLANKGIGTIGEPLLEWLRGADFGDPEIRAKARGYLVALEEVKVRIPEQVRNRLRSAGIVEP
jgi:hypothetical protein